MTENNFNFTNGVSYDVWYEQKRLIDQLKKENEELKNTLNKLTRGIVISKQEPEVINLANHYRKILKKIKSYFIKYDNDKLDSYETLDYIRDIMSEVKKEHE